MLRAFTKRYFSCKNFLSFRNLSNTEKQNSGKDWNPSSNWQDIISGIAKYGFGCLAIKFFFPPFKEVDLKSFEDILKKNDVKLIAISPLETLFRHSDYGVAVGSNVNGKLVIQETIKVEGMDWSKMFKYLEGKTEVSDQVTYEYYKLEIIFGLFIAYMAMMKRKPIDPSVKRAMQNEWKNEMKKAGKKGKKRQKDQDIFEKLPSVFDNFNMFDDVQPVAKDKNVKLKDVVGMREAKEEIVEFLQYIKNPEKFIKLGARLPRGALLTGPPGCGKTFVIKALAGECRVPFFSFAGSDFQSMIGGVGAKRIRNAFITAAKNTPSIIFIDELDSLGRKRSRSNVSSGVLDSEQTLNQLLIEMDGVKANSGVVVFAATNRPDLLDPALIRPGRLDRQIYIGLPAYQDRVELFQYYLGKLKRSKVSKDEVSQQLAKQTSGMSGADIANVCSESILIAVRENLKDVTENCLFEALDRIIMGQAKKSKVLKLEESKVLAYHEAGHVVINWLSKYIDPVNKITIIPRTSNILSKTKLDMTDRFLMKYEYLMEYLTFMLAGRASESIMLGQITSQANDDLETANKIAVNMVSLWGMSKVVGQLSFNVNKDKNMPSELPYSKSTHYNIETETQRILCEAYERAEQMIIENKDKIEIIAKGLLEKEVLQQNDINDLIGPRPNA